MEAATILRSQGVVAYPTETFYGLGCSALEQGALDALEELKPRDVSTKPYPLILGSLEQWKTVAQPLPEASKVHELIARFWPGPLTLIVPAVPGLDRRIVGPQGGVAIRVSPHPVAASLSNTLGGPIVSTSANPTGKPAPSTAEEVCAYFSDSSAGVPEGGVCAGGAPSTIVDCTGSTLKILRMGAISEEELSPWLKLPIHG